MELLCSLRRCFDPLKGVELTAVRANTLLSSDSVKYTFLCNTLEFGKIDARCLIAVGQQYFLSVFSLNCTLCVDSPVVAPEKTSQRSDRTTAKIRSLCVLQVIQYVPITLVLVKTPCLLETV